MKASLRPAVVGLFATFAVVMVTGPASASCAAGSGPEGSKIIFVGTAKEDRRGFTRMEVTEVWHGPDLAPTVWVLSGQEQSPWPLNALGTVSSSTDADLVKGGHYIVGASRQFSTGACSVEEVTSGRDLLRLRPSEVRKPVKSGSVGADPPIGPWATRSISVAVLSLVVGGVIALRRRRTS